MKIPDYGTGRHLIVSSVSSHQILELAQYAATLLADKEPNFLEMASSLIAENSNEGSAKVLGQLIAQSDVFFTGDKGTLTWQLCT